MCARQMRWLPLIFEKVDAGITPVLSPDEALENDHLRERERITTMNDPQRGETIQLGFPAKFSDDLNFRRSPAPFFGEHTREVLTGIGYSEEELGALRKEGVIDVGK